MELMMVDPRALKENPDQMRRTKSSPQADALLLASIKAVGIVQPPEILPRGRRDRDHGEAAARFDAQGHGNDWRPAHRRPS